MSFTTIKVAGSNALQTLDQLRQRYPTTGQYPFLIGDDDEVERIEETAESYEQDPAELVASALAVDLAAWVAVRRSEAEEYEFSAEETFGEWPGEILEKGSVSLHQELLTGAIKPEVYIGLAAVDEPWQLPAVVKYGGWNESPGPEVHAAFHRKWQAQYGAEITGMSGAVIECAVTNPPRTRDEAVSLAWELYWYCPDIVEQGCGNVAHLAAIVLNSPYWFFWWD